MRRRGFESGVRYIAKPLRRRHCFLIGGEPNSGCSVLIACQKPPFVRDLPPQKRFSGQIPEVPTPILGNLAFKTHLGGLCRRRRGSSGEFPRGPSSAVQYVPTLA